jgi:hypothetical protein
MNKKIVDEIITMAIASYSELSGLLACCQVYKSCFDCPLHQHPSHWCHTATFKWWWLHPIKRGVLI